MFPNWLGHSSHHNITKLALSECRNCCMLPSLGQLPCLKDLWISNFDGLEIIGAEFYKNDESCLETPFPSPETIRFYSMPCWKQWHSSEFDAFPRLKVLEIDNCPVLTADLPNQLPSLETLDINKCEQLNSSLPGTPAIHELRIRGNNKVRMGDPLPSLKTLRIEGSHLVEPVLEAISQKQLTCLQFLGITNYSSAISFPVACMPTSLQYLEIRNCKMLEFPVQQKQESLRALEISDSCDSLTSFSLDAFPNLAELYISGCENMKSLEVSQSVPSLRNLGIFNCPAFVSFTTLGMFAPQLESLMIIRCPEIDPFPKGDPQPNLTHLYISHSEKLMSFLTSMNSQSRCLTRLAINGDECENVKSFPNEGLLPASLESLTLCDFPSLETLDCKGLVHLTSLQQLTVGDCPKLENVAGERLPASLIRLYVNHSPLLGKRCEMKDPQIWPKISHIRSIEVNGEWIWWTEVFGRILM